MSIYQSTLICNTLPIKNSTLILERKNAIFPNIKVIFYTIILVS